MLIRTLLFCLLTLWHLLGSFAVQASAPLYHCNVIDFNGPEAGYGHFYPIDDISMVETDNGEDIEPPDPEVVTNYYMHFFDRSKQVTVLSGNNLAEVIAQCTDFVEQNDQFVVHVGQCDLTDMYGNYHSGTMRTHRGVSRFQRRDEGSQFDAFELTGMPWEMVYWHYIACDIPIMNTPIQVFPLPFVITYDDKDECEPGCP
ncbi:hypothetical protein ABC502_18505, partial [Alkalimonas sp. NCh-2]|uniref:hypothetical protein n=1 Tax=Alkalimonas sp. NCh-2 TaxID=3144846 RepID=UPI0031F6F56B